MSSAHSTLVPESRSMQRQLAAFVQEPCKETFLAARDAAQRHEPPERFPCMAPERTRQVGAAYFGSRGPACSVRSTSKREAHRFSSHAHALSVIKRRASWQ